jgi:hypothetical protein
MQKWPNRLIDWCLTSSEQFFSYIQDENIWKFKSHMTRNKERWLVGTDNFASATGLLWTTHNELLLGSLTCEEGDNLSTQDLSFIYVSSAGRVVWEFLHPAQPTDAPSSQRSSRSHFYTAGLTPFRGLVPLGWRNLVPILPPAHPLWVFPNIWV